MKKTLISRGKLMDLSHPKVMAIVNMTPDSFYSESRWLDKQDAWYEQVKQLIEDGADILDIGGYSTRPGASEVTVEEEIARVVPIITKIRSVEAWQHIWISVDTFRSEVAKAAVEAGADMINDVSGGNLDDRMFETVAALHVPYILMHMRGTPQTMTQLDNYDNLVFDILKDLHSKVLKLQALGVYDICIDPGFGFAKNMEQNYELVSKIESLYALDLPLLIGVSRKSMIWRYLGITADESLIGTTTIHALLSEKQIGFFRVHDVKPLKHVLEVVKMVQSKKYAVK